MTELPLSPALQPAPWQLISPALSINALAIDPFKPDTLYIGLESGVMKSIDRGTSWGLASDGLTDPNVTALVVDPSTPGVLYAGTSFDGVFKSTDGAASWQPINGGVLDRYPITVIVIDPRSTTTLFAGTYDGGIFKTMDGGITWQPSNSGLPDLIIDELLIDKTHTSTLYAAAHASGIFKSVDGGASWVSASTGLPPAGINITSLALDPAHPSTLYLGTSFGSVYRSTDTAGSWFPVASALTQGAVAGLVVVPQDPPIVYAAAWDAGIFASQDGGARWEPVNAGLPDLPVQVLAVDPLRPANLYAGTLQGGLYAMLPDTTNVQAALPEPAPARDDAPTVVPTALPAPTQSIPGGWRGSAATLAVDLLQNAPLAGMTLSIQKPGEATWSRGFGYADLGLSIPASPATVYPIGGLTMQFTAAAVMQLVEMGLLDLDTPIGLYVVGLPADMQSATLHQLLSHTSGIDDSITSLDLYSSPGTYTSQDLLQFLVPTFTLRDPGVSSGGYAEYILAGLVIEAVTGMSYADVVHQNVVRRAGLLHTGYCLPPPGNLAQGYYLSNGLLLPIQINTSAIFAAGGLCSTAEDLLQWNVALVSGSIVTPASYRRMLTATQPQRRADFISGYGLYSGQTPHGLMILSYGGMAGFSSILVSYPENGVNIALLTNTANDRADVFGLIEAITPQLMP